MNANGAEKQLKNCLHSKRKFQIEWKSLEDAWQCAVVLVMQTLCLYRACGSFKKFNDQSWQPYAKPHAELWLYLFFISINIVLLPVFVLTSLIKVGSYANDNFRFGLDLDTHELAKKSGERKKLHELKRQIKLNESTVPPQVPPATTVPFSTSSFLSDSSSLKLTSRSAGWLPTTALQLFKHLNSTLSFQKAWKKLMPISNVLHLIISFGLLFPQVLLVSKQIEYGLRPKGKYISNNRDKIKCKIIK